MLPPLHRSLPRRGLLCALLLTGGCDSCGITTAPPRDFDAGRGFPADFDGGVQDADTDFRDVAIWEGSVPFTATTFHPLDANTPDADAPSALALVSRFPGVDASDVPLDTEALQLTFNLALYEDRVPNVQVTHGPDAAVASATAHVDGERVVIALAEPLVAGESYTVEVRSSISAPGVDTLLPFEWASSWSFRAAEAPGTILLGGPLHAIAHDADRARLWGIDREARTLALVDLEGEQELARLPLVYVPSDLCVAPDGTRVYIVNRGSSLVTELDAESREVLRHIPWQGRDDGADNAHLHVRCGNASLWLVDAGTEPDLWHMDLSVDPPAVADHAAEVSGVGNLALSADESVLTYWTQSGWDVHQQNVEVRAVATDDLTGAAGIDIGPAMPGLVYLEAPIFVEADGPRVLAHNRVLSNDAPWNVLFTFDADEVLLAADFAHDRAASQTQVYSLSDYLAEEATVVDSASLLFFEPNGDLRLVVNDPPRLLLQPLATP